MLCRRGQNLELAYRHDLVVRRRDGDRSLTRGVVRCHATPLQRLCVTLLLARGISFLRGLIQAGWHEL